MKTLTFLDVQRKNLIREQLQQILDNLETMAYGDMNINYYHNIEKGDYHPSSKGITIKLDLTLSYKDIAD